MKVLVLLTSMLAFGSVSYAQESTGRYVSSQHMMSNAERYQIDYELANPSVLETNPSVIDDLELDRIEDVREFDQDITVVDSKTGLELIVYSRARVRDNKSSQPRKFATQAQTKH